MDYELKPWIWVFPAVGAGLLFGLVLWMGRSELDLAQYCAGGLVIVMAVLSVQAVSAYRAFYRDIFVGQTERLRRAESMTPLAMRLESAKGVHPDVVKAFMAQENRVWAIKNGNAAEGIVPHSVLYHAPEVTDIFVEYFLKSSSAAAVMPKRLLVEGRKNRFDPWGLVDEYTMYDKFLRLLAAQGKVVKYDDYGGYVWFAPWTPKLVAEEFALEWEEETKSK